MSKAATTHFAASFKNFLKQRGRSITAQRERIALEILNHKSHFDIEELLDYLKTKKIDISRATLYRTMSHLEEGGFIRRIDFDHGHAHYECTTQSQHHEHCVCQKCGTIVEIIDPLLEERIAQAAADKGFVMSHHQVQIIGLCKKCALASGSSKTRTLNLCEAGTRFTIPATTTVASKNIRALEMGLIPGAKGEVISIQGGRILVHVNGTRLGFGPKEAAAIHVTVD